LWGNNFFGALDPEKGEWINVEGEKSVELGGSRIGGRNAPFPASGYSEKPSTMGRVGKKMGGQRHLRFTI